MKSLSIIFTLGFLTLLSFWFLRDLTKEEGENNLKSRSKEQIVVSNLKGSYFDGSGSLRYSLTSDKVIEKGSEGSFFENVDIIVFEKEKLDWLASSDHAHLSEDLNFLRLHENVQLTYKGKENPIDLKTSVLNYDAVERTIYSKEKVYLETVGLEQESQGLLLNLDDEVIDLSDSIDATYQVVP